MSGGFSVGPAELNSAASSMRAVRGELSCVHLLLFDDGWTADRQTVSAAELRHVSRGKLMASRSAAEALDRSMQRMNGPRV